jgi:hypothetical protein
MDKDVLLVIIAGAVGGFFALAGSTLTYFLNERSERKNRARSYIKEALQPARKYANVMEMDIKNILLILVGLNTGLQKADVKALRQSVGNIRKYLVDNTWIPEINDKKVVEAWEKLSGNFAELHLVVGQYSGKINDNLKKVHHELSPANLQEIREVLKSENPEKIRLWIAPDEITQEIYYSIMTCLASVQNFRRQIELVSVE